MTNFNSTQPQMQQVPMYPSSYAYMPQPQMQPQSAAGVSAVSINIIQPQAFAQGAAPQPMPYYPQGSYYNNYAPQVSYPANYNNMTAPLGMNNSSLEKSSPPAPAPQPAIEAPKGDKTEKKDDKKKTKVLLTDDYLKSLENYLNNENPKIRLMGTKELLERFKEDEKRTTDVALTALLNKALQDPSTTVRFMALTILDVGYATGDQNTANILKQIQQTPDQYGEDALLASQVLLKMSGTKVDIPPKGATEQK